MQKISYRVLFLSFQIQSNRYVPIGNQNATNRYIPSIQKVRRFLLEVTWTLFWKVRKSPQHHPNSFHPTSHLFGSQGMATVAVAAASCSLWSEVGFVGVGGGAGRNSPLLLNWNPQTKNVWQFFCNAKAGWFSPPRIQSWLTHFPPFFLSWERSCIKTCFRLFLQSGHSASTLFLRDINFTEDFVVAQNHRVWACNGVSIVLHIPELHSKNHLNYLFYV